MPVRIMKVPFDAERELFQEEELNRFCATRHVTQKRAVFFAWQGKAWWTMWMEYEEVDRVDAVRPAYQATILHLLTELQRSAEIKGLVRPARVVPVDPFRDDSSCLASPLRHFYPGKTS
jgi:hypothetical protein